MSMISEGNLSNLILVDLLVRNSLINLVQDSNRSANGVLFVYCSFFSHLCSLFFVLSLFDFLRAFDLLI